MSETNKARKARHEQRRVDGQRKRRYIYFGIGGIILIGLFFIFQQGSSTPVIEVEPARLESNPSLGAEDARVVLTELGDFTCSACRSWHQAGIVNQILEQYDGLLRVEWRDFPIITADSPKAAEAGQCAFDQGNFWEYLDRVYSEPGSSYGNGTENKLKVYAQDIGLDVEKFNACLDSNQHQMTVDVDLDFAQSLGLRGTPSFLVNGTPVVGANPELLIQTIEAELAIQN